MVFDSNLLRYLRINNIDVLSNAGSCIVLLSGLAIAHSFIAAL